MRIGISARSLAYGFGGPTEYLRGLITALLDLDSDHEFLLFYPDATYRGTFPRAVELDLACRNRLVFDWLALPRALRRHACDVVLLPSSNMADLPYAPPFSLAIDHAIASAHARQR